MRMRAHITMWAAFAPRCDRPKSCCSKLGSEPRTSKWKWRFKYGTMLQLNFKRVHFLSMTIFHSPRKVCPDIQRLNGFEISGSPVPQVLPVQQVVDLDEALLERRSDEGQPLGRGLDDVAQARNVQHGEFFPDGLVCAEDLEEVPVRVAKAQLEKNPPTLTCRWQHQANTCG